MFIIIVDLILQTSIRKSVITNKCT